jgi:hypothetical protein
MEEMITALLSFFGGNAFRMIFGEIMAFFNKKTDHQQELERMELQGRLDAEQAERNLKAIETQAKLGVQTIRVQGEVDLDKLAAEGFNTAVELTGRMTGIKWVDAWNQAIRPALATICIFLVVRHVATIGWKLDEMTWGIVGAALGIFVADRQLLKRGK